MIYERYAAYCVDLHFRYPQIAPLTFDEWAEAVAA